MFNDYYMLIIPIYLHKDNKDNKHMEDLNHQSNLPVF